MLISTQHKSQADLVVGDFIKRAEQDYPSGHPKIFDRSRLLTKDEIQDYVMLYSQTPYQYILFVHCWAKLYLREKIEAAGLRFDQSLHNFEDVEFNFSYLMETQSVYYLDKAILNYSVTRNFRSQSFQIGNDIEKVRAYKRAFDSVHIFLRSFLDGTEAARLRGHLISSCIIITIARTCGQYSKEQSAKVYEGIDQIIRDSYVLKNLSLYKPGGGDSRILPLLIRLRCVRLIIWYGAKRIKRYRHRGSKEIVKTCLRLRKGLCLGPDAIRPCLFSAFDGPVY